MAFADLREFVAHLEKHGRLRRVSAPVSRDLEIAEIADRVSKSAGRGQRRAALRERATASTCRCSSTRSAREERMAAALGVERLDELGERVAKLLDLRLPGTFVDKLRKLGDALRRRPGRRRKRVSSAACQEVVETDRAVAGRAARSSAAGRATAAATSRCPSCSRAIPSPARATSACTASRSTTTRRSACTGRPTRAAPSTSARRAEQRPASACPWRSRSAAIPP